ncbi:MAG: hypothetical protein JKY02_10985 [Flavobacteriaceae bacterium]|nr:hypothetical protein [Flavobacteriaceae bacterium]
MLLPATIQLVHVFEQHEHIICSSDTEQHFHEDDAECVLCHLQSRTTYIGFTNNYEVIPTSFYQSYDQGKTVVFASGYLFKKPSRGPPYFTV